MTKEQLDRLEELTAQTSWTHEDIREMSLLHEMFYSAYKRVVYDFSRYDPQCRPRQINKHFDPEVMW